jgi:hypothetical protein
MVLASVQVAPAELIVVAVKVHTAQIVTRIVAFRTLAADMLNALILVHSSSHQIVVTQYTTPVVVAAVVHMAAAEAVVAAAAEVSVAVAAVAVVAAVVAMVADVDKRILYIVKY